MLTLALFAPAALLALASLRALRRSRATDPLLANLAPAHWERRS